MKTKKHFVVKDSLVGERMEEFNTYEQALKWASNEVMESGGAAHHIFEEIYLAKVVADIKVVKVVEKKKK